MVLLTARRTALLLFSRQLDQLEQRRIAAEVRAARGVRVLALSLASDLSAVTGSGLFRGALPPADTVRMAWAGMPIMGLVLFDNVGFLWP